MPGSGQPGGMARSRSGLICRWQLVGQCASLFTRLIYTAFQTPSRQHLYLQTIGDAFMCVGGCPVAEPPEEAAARVAEMALDMIRTAQVFRSSWGQRLRIRVGIASGGVAAAVIGKKM